MHQGWGSRTWVCAWDHAPEFALGITHLSLRLVTQQGSWTFLEIYLCSEIGRSCSRDQRCRVAVKLAALPWYGCSVEKCAHHVVVGRHDLLDACMLYDGKRLCTVRLAFCNEGLHVCYIMCALSASRVLSWRCWCRDMCCLRITMYRCQNHFNFYWTWSGKLSRWKKIARGWFCPHIINMEREPLCTK